jgi:hypothetical protein
LNTENIPILKFKKLSYEFGVRPKIRNSEISPAM